MLSPPPAAATSTRASKAGIVRTIEPCCSSAIHHAWRLHSRLHLGRKCRLEKVALVVRRSEAAGWRWSSSTLNECKPRFLGVAVMHWARPMAAELRDSRSERRPACAVATLASKARLRKQLHDAKTVLKSRYSSALAVSFSAVCPVGRAIGASRHTQFSPLFSPRNTHAGWKVNRPYNTSMRW